MRIRSRLTLSLAAAFLALSCGSGSDDHLEETEVSVMLSIAANYFGQPYSESKDIELDFDSVTTSLLMYAVANGPATEERLLFVSKLTGPDGTALVDLSKTTDPADLRARHAPVAPSVIGADGIVSFALPESDGPALPRGLYKMRLAGTVGSAEVRVVRRLKEKTDSGRLDLNLFFVEGTDLSAFNSKAVNGAVDAFFKFVSEARIERGSVKKFDIKGADASKFVSIDASDFSLNSPLRQLMLKASLASEHRAINIFFVRSLDVGEGLGTMLGLSLGIPTALTLGATANSGVVISLEGHSFQNGSFDVETMGRTIAHEAAHSMGLFHTTEASTQRGGVYDLVSDTLECPTSADVDRNGILDPSECFKFDSRNFMFWEGLFSKEVSAGQGAVLRQSVVVRGDSE